MSSDQEIDHALPAAEKKSVPENGPGNGAAQKSPEEKAGKPADKAKSRKLRLRILIAALVILACVGIYVLLHWGEIETDDAQIEATVSTIAPKVSGYITHLYITDNTRVKKGDVMLQIDPRDYQVRVAHAEANLTAAKAQLASGGQSLAAARVNAPSSIDTATAQVAQTKAAWDVARANLARMKSLSLQARSQQQLDVVAADEKSAHANYDAAIANQKSADTSPRNIAIAQARTDELAAQVKQAEADLLQAQIDLSETKIIAPIDGRVANRGIEQGDYVQTGQQLFSLIGTDIYVIANFKETQLRHMKAGQMVSVRADAFSNLSIRGKVDSIQYGTGARFSAFPPENATGNFVKIVQRVPVKIILTEKPDENIPLGPGMSVEPTVYTQ